MTEWSNNEPIVCWPYTNYTQIHRKKQRQRRPRRRRRWWWWVGILNRFTNSRAPCSGLERDNGSAGSKSKTWLNGKMFHRRRRRQWNRNFPEKSLRSLVLDCNCSAANFDGIAGYNWWFCCGCCFYIFANYEMTIIIPIACQGCKFCRRALCVRSPIWFKSVSLGTEDPIILVDLVRSFAGWRFLIWGDT